MKHEGVTQEPPSDARRPSDSFDRRAFLQRGAAASLGLGVLLGNTGCAMIQEQKRNLVGPIAAEFGPLPTTVAASVAVHVLNRVGFGPRPGDVAKVAQMGAAAWIEEQLADKMPEDPTVTWRVNGLDTQQMEQDSPDTLNTLPDGQLLKETQQAALLRAVYSRHQLRESLADFWTNHFNIYAIKNDGRFLIPVDTERVLRPHLLGKFRDLLTGSANSPAMLAYLDNNLNRKGVANENYARELLELHTVGVNSGYTLNDIQEVARCFTGWTVQTGLRRGMFAFDPSLHDNGPKYIPFLDLTIAPRGGKKDAEIVLESLVTNPATARFLARKLCRHFLGTMPDATIEKAASAYLKHDSDIRQMLRPILLDSLLTPTDNKPKLKRPMEFAVSALRALAADTDGGTGVQEHLEKMGQPLYQWPMPDGFPVKASAWTGSLLPRWNFALALASNTIGNTTIDLGLPLKAANATTDDAKLNALIEAITAHKADAPEVQPTREQVGRHIERARQANVPEATILAETAGLLLCAPPFQWR